MTWKFNEPPWKKDGPQGAINTKAAQESYSHPDDIEAGCGLQFKPAPISELQLSAAAWRNCSEFSQAADAFALHESDFDNRLCGVLCGYLRWIGEQGGSPSKADALAVLRALSVIVTDSELDLILETPICPGDSLADLILAVQRNAEFQAEMNARYATQAGLREVLDFVIACPNWRDELRDFRRWTQRQKEFIAHEYVAGHGSLKAAVGPTRAPKPKARAAIHV